MTSQEVSLRPYEIFITVNVAFIHSTRIAQITVPDMTIRISITFARRNSVLRRKKT